MSDLRMCPYTDCGTYAICPHHAPLSCGREAGTVVTPNASRIVKENTDAPDDSCPQCGNPLVGYDHSMCSINEDGDER
jgi:hypothetical protein